MSIFLEPQQSDLPLAEDAARCARSVPNKVLETLGQASPSGLLIVRSSASDESMLARGSFASRTCQRADIEQAIAAVWLQAIEGHLVESNCRIGIIVQPVLDAKVRGHLSNEFRLSRENRQWTSEIEEPPAEATQWRVSLDAAADQGPLFCSSINQLDDVLRRVAASFCTSSRRYHLEWVWDGRRVWVVQADSVNESKGPAPGDAWAPTRGLPVQEESLAAFKKFVLSDDRNDEWPKLRGVRLFASASLPTTDLYVLSDTACLTAIAKGEIPDAVASDLRLLASGHVVIRTDVRGSAPKFMLPKTKATCDHVELENFLTATLQALSSETNVEDVAFIAHRFLRSRASAWALATPSGRLVEIDANWGLPDGLNWLPHDSFLVDAKTGAVRRSVLGKTDFLDIAEDEAWNSRETPSEWIWRAVLGDADARFIAKATQRLADASGKPVLVMWFVELLDGSDHRLLPWFMANDVPTIEVRKARWEDGRAATIRTRDDLVALDQQDDGVYRRMILEPSPALIRDKDFVDAAGELASRLGLTIEIHGSRLAHAYYLLRKRGLAVHTREGDLGSRNFGKLVRDLVPEQVDVGGERSEVYHSRPEELSHLLRQKLIEEALEVRSAEGRTEVLAELGDVQEVVDAILAQIGETRSALLALQRKKRRDRGGFNSGKVLLRTTVMGSSDETDVPTTLPGLEELMPRRVGRRVEVSFDRIRLPLVPPGPLDAGEEVVTLPGRVGQARIRYGARFVDLEIEALRADEMGPREGTLF